MKTLRTVCVLSALTCVAAHGQTCSGVDGGMDATGNQCNARGNDSNFAPPAAVMTRPGAVPAAAPTRVHDMSTGSRSTGTPALAPHVAAAGQPTSRFPVIAQPPVASGHTAKSGSAQEAPCSGGMDGGMDATGNQCNPADLAGTVVVANVRRR
jgi:hypothetical protein